MRLVVAALALAVAATAQTCPNPPVPSLATEVPADVCIPKGFTDLTIDFFDDFSWRSMIALTHTFEKFHALWEVFHEDGSAPGNAAKYNACSTAVKPGDMVLASFNGIGDIGQAGDGAILPPLAAQNGRYLRYLESYNEIAYDHIVSNQWYLRSHLPEVPVPRPPVPPVQFPNGSIAVKSAWVVMTGFSEAQQQRYYTRKATVRNPATGKCSSETVGLIGIHIIQKTPSRPQWIWSSFEHVDNVPPAEAGSTGKFALHDGTSTPMPAHNPLTLIPLAPEPVTPFNVTRSEKLPVHPRTAATNERYRKLLKDTVWSNYQLVLTQWPLAPGDQSVPVAASQAGDIFESFPGEGATSTFANMSMEPFGQSRPAQGCMGCHNRARLPTDFMWSVLEHAYPAKIALPAAR
jgi:hypothetical protein